MDMRPRAQRLRQPVGIEPFDFLRCTNDDTDAAHMLELVVELEVLGEGLVLAEVVCKRL